MTTQFKQIAKKAIDEDALVSVKKMGSKYNICWCEHRNNRISIRKIDKDHYVNLSTGEVLKSNHIENRFQNKSQIAQSLKRLRDIINTNVVDLKKCRWITLTYKENMKDVKQLYYDVDKFIKRFRYRYGNIEYINVCEPQSRGAWHCHIIIIFPNEAPFIPNEELSEIWGLGFTKIQSLYGNISNIGAYFTSYIGDISLEEATNLGIKYDEEELKKVTHIGGKKLKTPKYFIKGARLMLYPPNINLYRTSRGIKRPEVIYMSYKEAKEKIGLGQPTYSKTFKYENTDNHFTNTIIYEYYNTDKKDSLYKSLKNKIVFKLRDFKRFNNIKSKVITLYSFIKNRLKLAFKMRK